MCVRKHTSTPPASTSVSATASADQSTPSSAPASPEVTVRRSERHRRPPDHLQDYVCDG